MLKTTYCLTIFSIILVGCGKFTVKVDPRSQTKSDPIKELSDLDQEDSDRRFSLADIEVYLSELDEIKTTDPSLLTQSLQQGLRNDFRQALREIRRALIKNADGRQGYSKSIFVSLDEKLCRELKIEDFSFFDGFEVLGTLLKTAALTNIDPISAAKLNPSLPTKIDDITILILSELGVSARGHTTVSEDGDRLLTKSEIIWHIINEVGDEEFIDEDKYSVRLAFTREEGSDDYQALSLRIDVAKGLFENTYSSEEADLYFLELVSQQSRNESDGLQLSVNATSGFNMMGEDLFRYNRKLEFSQENPSLDLFRFKDTNRYQMSGESTRTALIDLAALKACVEEPDDLEEKPDTDLPIDEEKEKPVPKDPVDPIDEQPEIDDDLKEDEDEDEDDNDDMEEEDDPSLPPFDEDDPSQSD